MHLKKNKKIFEGKIFLYIFCCLPGTFAIFIFFALLGLSISEQTRETLYT